MPGCGVACSPTHWHTFPLRFWAMRPRRSRENVCQCLGLDAATSIGILVCPILFWATFCPEEQQDTVKTETTRKNVTKIKSRQSIEFSKKNGSYSCHAEVNAINKLRTIDPSLLSNPNKKKYLKLFVFRFHIIPCSDLKNCLGSVTNIDEYTSITNNNVDFIYKTTVSKPCINCTSFIKSMNIPFAYYST